MSRFSTHIRPTPWQTALRINRGSPILTPHYTKELTLDTFLSARYACAYRLMSLAWHVATTQRPTSITSRTTGQILLTSRTARTTTAATATARRTLGIRITETRDVFCELQA